MRSGNVQRHTQEKRKHIGRGMKGIAQCFENMLQISEMVPFENIQCLCLYVRQCYGCSIKYSINYSYFSSVQCVCFHSVFSLSWQCLHRAFPNELCLCWALSRRGSWAHLRGGRGGGRAML